MNARVLIVASEVDAGLDGMPPKEASGILFDGEDAQNMTAAVSRAFALYENPSRWHAIQCNAMATDFSWEQPAKDYIAVYREVAADAAREFFDVPAAAPDTDVVRYMTA